MPKKKRDLKRLNSRELLWEFLERMDKRLKDRVRVYLIGGGSLVLAYGIPRFTADLDFLDDAEARELKKIFEAHREDFEETGLEIQLVPPDWFPLPKDYEERSVPLRRKRLKKLDVRILKMEDLVLAKLARASSKDLDDIRWLAQNFSLDPEALLERYRKGRGNLSSGLPRLDDAFRYLMLDLFGRRLGEKALG